MEQHEEQTEDFESAFAEMADDDAARPSDDDTTVTFQRETEVSDEADDEPDDAAQEDEQEDEGGVEAPSLEDRLQRLESERDDWKHRYQSDAGRIAALQRRVQELQTAPHQRQPTAKDMASAMADDESWKEFKETYPEIATVIDKRLSTGFNQINEQVASRVQRIEAGEGERMMREQIMMLEKEHEDCVEVIRDPAFTDWLVRQPGPIQTMAHSNMANDVGWVLTQYKRDNAPQNPGHAPGDATAAIKAQRQRKLEEAQAPTTVRTNRQRPVARDDFEGAFSAFASQVEKRRQNNW